MNKKIPTGIVIGIMLIVVIIIGGLFWLGNKNYGRINCKEIGYRIEKENIIYCSNDYYMGYEENKVNGADPNHFVILNERYAKDNDNVFSSGLKIIQPDAASFSVLAIYAAGSYTKDKYHVYYSDEIVENADPNTFTIIEISPFAKDLKNIYYHGKIFYGADVATFTNLDGTVFKDKKKCM
ncbi:MAG: DKNYY domain-containing protein [Candidatus Moraniibacteriota bacterium]